MNREAALSTFHVGAQTALIQAQPWQTHAVSLDSPAYEVMTDLASVKAATIAPDATLVQAEQAMIFLGVRMLFVVEHMPHIEGLLTLTDLRGERPMRLLQQHTKRFDEIRVSDVMTGLSMLEAVDYADLRTATVRNLIATLKRRGRNHLLVAEGNPANIRGVISKSQIERQLGQTFDVVEVANNFAEIERMLA